MDHVTWDALCGQDEAAALLARVAASGRVASGYLFVGPSGVGRRTAALIFAAALECREGGCGNCPSCHAVAHGVHPDVRLWQRDEEKKVFPIGLVRDIIASLSLRPYQGRFKVAIIDEADAMNQEAANAFLLTLEEPPPNTVLILVAANPQLLPETIASRCQRVSFRPLPDEVVFKLLAAKQSRQPQAEIGAEGGAAKQSRQPQAEIGAEGGAAKQSRQPQAEIGAEGGASGGAAGLEDARVAALMAEGSLTTAKGYLGGDWRQAWESILELAAKVISRDPEGIFNPLVAATAAREEAERFLLVLERILRLALRSHLGLSAGMAEEDRRIAGLGRALDRAGFIRALDGMRRAQGLLRGNVGGRLVVEGLLLELAAAGAAPAAHSGAPCAV